MQTGLLTHSTSVVDTASSEGPGAWGIIVVAIVFQLLVYGSIVSSFSFWISAWMHTFGVKRVLVMTLSTEVLVISALIAPIGGYFMDRWSARGTVCVGLLLFAGGWLTMSIAQHFWQVQFIYGLGMGIGLGLVGPAAAQTMVAKRFRLRRGFALGTVVMGAALGGIIWPPALVWLFGYFDWRTLARMLAAGGIALVPLIAVVIRIPTEAPRESACNYAGVPRLNVSGGTKTAILSGANFWVLILAFLPAYMAGLAYMVNYSPIMSERHSEPQQAALIYALMCTVSILSKPVFGRLSDHYDPRFILIGGIMIMDVGFTLMMRFPGVIRIMAANMLIGIGLATFFPLQGILLARYFDTAIFGRAVGLMNFFLLLGALAGPIAGAARDAFGSYDYVLLCFGTLAFISTFFVLTLRDGLKN